MFETRTTVVREGAVLQYTLLKDEEVLTYATVIDLWQSSQTFRTFYVALLNNAPFQTYRWETPAIISKRIAQPFEFVLINHPGLAAVTDKFTFRHQFLPAEKNAGIAVFDNLGRDALLIVPSPRSDTDKFNHLAQFTRTASAEQNHALWKTVGAEMEKRINDKPVWLNTAGDGVSWLHIRLDDRPKYYRYGPYRVVS